MGLVFNAEVTLFGILAWVWFLAGLLSKCFWFESCFSESNDSWFLALVLACWVSFSAFSFFLLFFLAVFFSAFFAFLAALFSLFLCLPGLSCYDKAFLSSAFLFSIGLSFFCWAKAATGSFLLRFESGFVELVLFLV